MNKHIPIWLFLLSIIILLSNATLAVETEIKNTSIDYVPYREVVVNEPGVVYQIKIINTGTREKTYEIIPDSEVIRNIGTYRIDPSDKITLKPGEKETVYFYLAVEKAMSGRTVIPLKIRTGLSETTIELVARSIEPLQPWQRGVSLINALRTLLIILLVIVIIIALIFFFTKIRKKKEKGLEEEPKAEFDEDIDTYY